MKYIHQRLLCAFRNEIQKERLAQDGKAESSRRKSLRVVLSNLSQGCRNSPPPELLVIAKLSPTAGKYNGLLLGGIQISKQQIWWCNVKHFLLNLKMPKCVVPQITSFEFRIKSIKSFEKHKVPRRGIGLPFCFKTNPKDSRESLQAQ